MSQSPNNNIYCALLPNDQDYKIIASYSGSYKNVWLEAPLKMMLKLVEEHLPAVGKSGERNIKYKRALWRFIKEKLELAGYFFTAAQIEEKYRYIEQYCNNVNCLDIQLAAVEERTCPEEPEIGHVPDKQNSPTRCSKKLQKTEDKHAEIFDLLESWGLADLKAKFKANYIVLQALEYLTEADIIELIPKIGQRAIFRARLNQWRQQKTSTNINVPEPKKIKLEPGIEVRLQPQPFQQQSQQQLAQQLPFQQQSQQQMPQQQPIEQQISPQPPLQSNVVHKVYGTLTKITPKPRAKRVNKKANNSNNAQTPNIQSRVQQFIIGSPPSTTTTGTGICRLPSPPSVTNAPNGTRIAISSPTSLFYNLPPHIECRRFPAIAPPRPSSSQIHTPVPTHIHPPVSTEIHTPVSTRVINSDNLSNANAMARNALSHGTAPTYVADLTPFATSIIRVETNCETQYPSTGEPSLQNPITKFKRTTIIQKLTADKKTTPPQTKMPKPMIMPKPIEQLQKPAAVTRSPEIEKSPEVPRPKTILIPKEEPIEIMEDDDDTLDATDWNDFCEKRTNPEIPPIVEKELEVEPEHQAEPEPETELEPEAVTEAVTEGQPEIDPEPNPEVEEFTLSDDVTEIPDLIKDELLDSDSRSDQDGTEHNINKGLLGEMKDPNNGQHTQEPKADITRLDIRNVLMSSKLGRRVIKRYVAEEILDEATRRLLVETVAQYCFDNKIHITPTYCKDIAEEIIEIFPNERMEDYWRKGRKLRPPIYNKFHGIRRDYFRKKALTTNPKPINNKMNNEIEQKSSLAPQDIDYDDDDNLIIS